eukprot:1151892-Pelagomonas_calceolata.AAC.2
MLIRACETGNRKLVCAVHGTDWLESGKGTANHWEEEAAPPPPACQSPVQQGVLTGTSAASCGFYTHRAHLQAAWACLQQTQAPWACCTVAEEGAP